MASSGLLLPVGLVIFVVVTALVSTMRPSWRLVVAAILMPLQVFLPSVPLPLGQIWGLILLLTGLLFTPRLRTGRQIYLSLTLLGLATLLALTYSPDKQDAVGTLLRLAGFAGVLLTFAQAAEEEDGWWRPVVLSGGAIIALQATLTILFRLDPTVERTALTSGLGAVIYGPAGAGLYGASPNNVIDPEKAGGLAVNGNAASMFLGVALFFCMAMWTMARERSWLWLGALVIAAVYATGSKTGIGLAVVLPTIALGVKLAFDRKAPEKFAFYFVCAIPAALLGLRLVLQGASEYVSEAGASFDSRSVIWEVARTRFAEDPLFGLGFGGWFAENVAVLNGLPPHNLFIRAWADSGLLGLATTLFVVFALLRHFWRAARTSAGSEQCALAICGLFGWLWIFVHGMGDNTTLYGEARTTFLAASLVGLLQVSRHPSPAEVLVTRKLTGRGS